MIKASLSLLALTLVTAASYHVCTEVGFRTPGSHVLVVEVTGRPSYDSVGQNLYARDGSKVLVNGISRGDGAKHEIHATVYGTHRYSLALFPTRWVHAFSMDQPAVELAVKEATVMNPDGAVHESQRRWHVLN